MKRTKLPALTSPWKIGFFVSLMLVSVSVGVAYFFINKFGVSWNWLDKNEWMAVIRGEGFVYELLPAIALVAVTAMFSYLVIARAVRKYKRYLDSGLDYKNLLMSLKEAKDLEDISKIEKIRNNPELKRLLLGVSEQLSEQREALVQRENEMEQMTDDAVIAKHEELTEGFAAQCESLATAIREGADDLMSPETGVSNLSLRTLGEAIQNRLETAPPADAGAGAPGVSVETSAVVLGQLDEITTELRESSNGAKEIEKLLKEMSGIGGPETDKGRLDAARGEIRGALDTLKSLDELSTSLDVMSEEARGIAISTALHAGSGEGTQDDLIRLAEEVKEIAMRFKEGTESFSQVASGMRSSMGSLEAFIGGEMRPETPEADPRHSFLSLSNRVSLWVERVMVLTEKVAGLQAAAEEPVASAVAPAAFKSPEPEDVAAADSDDAFEKTEAGARFPEQGQEFGFEMLDRSKSLFSDSTDAPETAEPEVPQDAGIFEEMSAESADEADATDHAELGDEEPVEERTTDEALSADQADVTGEKEEASEIPAEPEVKDTALPGFETFARQTTPEYEAPSQPAEAERFNVDEDRFGSQKDRLQPFEDTFESGSNLKAQEKEKAEPAPETSQPEELGDVVDLYALGAVDYDEAVHG